MRGVSDLGKGVVDFDEVCVGVGKCKGYKIGNNSCFCGDVDVLELL